MNQNASKEEVLKAVETLSKEAAIGVLFFSEKLLSLVRGHKCLAGKFVIEIPQTTEEFNAEHIDNLVKETLGIKLKTE